MPTTFLRKWSQGLVATILLLGILLVFSETTTTARASGTPSPVAASVDVQGRSPATATLHSQAQVDPRLRNTSYQSDIAAADHVHGTVDSFVVPTFSQNDPHWASQTLGFNPACCDQYGRPWSIGNYGCFITSLSMLFDRYQSLFTDPGRINQSLIALGPDVGYEAGTGLLIWGGTDQVAPSGVTYAGTDTSWLTTDQDLAAGRPVLAWVSSSLTSSHMAVLVGKTGGTYTINDPWDGGIYTWPNGALAGTGYNLLQFYRYNGSGGSTTLPVVSAFAVSPSSVILGDAFTINYTVSDAGGPGLKPSGTLAGQR